MATVCDMATGRAVQCKTSRGGWMAFYFANFGDFDGVTYDPVDTDVISDLGSAVTVYEYAVKGGSTFDEVGTSAAANGTTFYQQNGTIILPVLSEEMNEVIKTMQYGRPHIIGHHRSGASFVFGLLEGTDVTAAAIGRGAAQGDLVGYTLTVLGEEAVPANFLLGSTLEDPFAGLTTPPTVVSE